jgi:hypothetical protein
VSKILEVKTIEPAALSRKGTVAYLSLSMRTVSSLIADGTLIAKQSGGRTLVDFDSVKKYYQGLPLKTVSASIPNAPQCARSAPAHRKRVRRQ